MLEILLLAWGLGYHEWIGAHGRGTRGSTVLQADQQKHRQAWAIKDWAVSVTQCCIPASSTASQRDVQLEMIGRPP